MFNSKWLKKASQDGSPKLPAQTAMSQMDSIEDDSALAEIAQELQLAMADYAPMLSTEDARRLLATRLLRICLHSYCSQLASRRLRLKNYQRQAHAQALLRDKAYLVQVLLMSGKTPDGTPLYSYDTQTLEEGFCMFDFIQSFLEEPSAVEALRRFKKFYDTVLDELGDQGVGFVLSVTKLRSDIHGQDKKRVLEQFEDRMMDWQEIQNAKSTDSIAQKMNLPWCSLSDEKEGKSKNSPPAKSTRNWLSFYKGSSSRAMTHMNSEDGGRSKSPKTNIPGSPMNTGRKAPVVKETRRSSDDKDVSMDCINLDDFLGE